MDEVRVQRKRGRDSGSLSHVALDSGLHGKVVGCWFRTQGFSLPWLSVMTPGVWMLPL